MLYYDRNYLSEGIDINKTNGSHECKICHYMSLFKINFNFQPCECDVFHDFWKKTRCTIEVSVKKIVTEVIFQA